ncbi:hypothetical protein [Crossiella cryophila]|uniref:2'-5' RNA ligase n=1 Tax=Crossiella cryophila TaxID=43355 RepID=A0A7W7CB41_9PSEU|nr:hypothetical protein [Crossiella cryophila]MBB4676608.1 hypothetical protein [Crossiella cryophila]
MDDRVYCWHIPLKEHLAVHRLAGQYQGALRRLPQLHPCAPPWLRLPLRELGPAERLRYTDVQAITAAARERLAEVPALALVTGRVIRRRGSVALAVTGDLRPVRRALAAAVAGVLGRRPRWPRPPRLLLAEHTEPVDPAQLRRILAAVRAEPVRIPVEGVSLALLRRHRGQRLWSELDRVELGLRVSR